MNAPTQASRHAKLWFPGLGQLGNSGVALLSPKSIARWGLTIDVLFSKVVLYNNRSVLVHSIRNPDLIRLTEQEIPEMTEEVLHGNLRDSPRFEGMQGLCTLEDHRLLRKLIVELLIAVILISFIQRYAMNLRFELNVEVEWYWIQTCRMSSLISQPPTISRHLRDEVEVLVVECCWVLLSENDSREWFASMDCLYTLNWSRDLEESKVVIHLVSVSWRATEWSQTASSRLGVSIKTLPLDLFISP